MLRSIGRMTTSMSVRGRIILLAAIPVIGFVANGVSFMIGEADVEKAFASAKRAGWVSDRSQDFKAALATMRISARDFAARPTQDLIETFGAAHALAGRSLGAIDSAIDETDRKNLVPLHDSLAEVAVKFSSLAQKQDVLGFTIDDGIRRRMRAAAASVERIIHEDMSWMQAQDSQDLLISLLTMRRYETEYRMTGETLPKVAFVDEFNAINRKVGAIVGAAILKEQLAQQIKAYVDTFNEWIQIVDEVGPLTTLIDIDTRNMMPVADRIIESAGKNDDAATEALAAAQARTRHFITWFGFAAALIGLGFSWIIGRSITRPLNGLADVMKRLADGDTTARIPATRTTDEIGAMARTVIVFRDNMIERGRLSDAQAAAARAGELRSESVATSIAAFRGSVRQALAKLRGTAERLEASSTRLNAAADAVTSESQTAEGCVGAAS